MGWTKVVTEPLGIAGFALFLVFGVVGRLTTKKSPKYPQWIMPVAYVLAAACILGGFILAYQHASLTSTAASPPPTMRIDKIGQKADNGIAVAGVQGDVSVSKPEAKKDPKPQHKP